MKHTLIFLSILLGTQFLQAQKALKHTTAKANIPDIITPTNSFPGNGSFIQESIDSTDFVFITPDGTNGNTYPNNAEIAFSSDDKWQIVNAVSTQVMPVGVVFNVLIIPGNFIQAFTHTATEANTQTSPFKTFSGIENPLTFNKPNLKLLITQRIGGPFATHNDHAPQVANSGACCLKTPVRWYIGNNGGVNDGTDYMPITGGGKLGATFNVLVSERKRVPGFPANKAFVLEQVATTQNTTGAHTFIDYKKRLIPQNTLLFVAPLWGKGKNCTEGPHNISPVAVKFNEGGKNKWSIYNTNGKPMPIGSKFNVFVVLE